VVLGIPAIAASQQSLGGEMDFRAGLRFDFSEAATFVARLVEELEDVPVPQGTLLNINAPGGDAKGARVCRLGKRIYRDKMELVDEDEDGRRRYQIYGERPGHHEEEGTDFEALSEGLIAVTPLHFDLTDEAGIEALSGFDLDGLIRPAAREVE